MKLSRLLTAGITAAMAVGLGIAGAPGAGASTMSLGCMLTDRVPGSFTANYSAGLGRAWPINAGEKITMTVTSMDSGTSLGLKVNGTTVATGVLADGHVDYTFAANSTITSFGSANADNWNGSFTCTAAPDPAPLPAPDPSPGPDLTPWLQAYARAHADATCTNDYSPSWAEWPFGHTGGWVCVKTTRAYAS